MNHKLLFSRDFGSAHIYQRSRPVAVAAWSCARYMHLVIGGGGRIVLAHCCRGDHGPVRIAIPQVGDNLHQ